MRLNKSASPLINKDLDKIKVRTQAISPVHGDTPILKEHDDYLELVEVAFEQGRTADACNLIEELIKLQQEALLSKLQSEVDTYYLRHDGEGEHKLMSAVDKIFNKLRLEL